MAAVFIKSIHSFLSMSVMKACILEEEAKVVQHRGGHKVLKARYEAEELARNLESYQRAIIRTMSHKGPIT